MGNNNSREKKEKHDWNMRDNSIYKSDFDYICKARFVPSGPGELLLRKSEFVKVIKQSADRNWLLVQRRNSSLKDDRYEFHTMKGLNYTGSFMVRLGITFHDISND